MRRWSWLLLEVSGGCRRYTLKPSRCPGQWPRGLVDGARRRNTEEKEAKNKNKIRKRSVKWTLVGRGANSLL